MSHELKNLVREFYEAAWNRGDLDAASGFLAPDLIDHNPLQFPGRPPGWGV